MPVALRDVLTPQNCTLKNGGNGRPGRCGSVGWKSSHNQRVVGLIHGRAHAFNAGSIPSRHVQEATY